MLVYMTFEGHLPRQGSLARPIKKGYANVQCLDVDEEEVSAYVKEGWSKTLEEAEKPAAKKPAAKKSSAEKPTDDESA